MASNIQIANIIKNYFPEGYKGTLVEVGAAHPIDIDISISDQFRPDWKIISIEPNPDFVNEFHKLGLECLQYACCAEDKGQTEFRISPAPMSSSALEVRYPGNFPIENHAGGWWKADQFKTIQVEALTLNTVLQKHHPDLDKIDVLIVDVEGWELEVMDGFNLEKYQPKMVILEDASPHMIEIKNEAGDTETLSKYYMYMRDHGYPQKHEEEQDKFYLRNG